MHRSCWIWLINGPDPINISQSEMASGGYHVKVVIVISASQRGLSINCADRHPRLTRNIASSKYEGALTKGPGTMRYAIAISHWSSGADTYACNKVGPDGSYG